MNNKIVNAVGSKIDDIASSIVNSKWGKTVIPTVEELNETIANNARLSGPLYTENIQRGLESMFVSADIPKDVAERMSKSVNAKNYTKAIDNLSDEISKHTDKPVDKITQMAKTITEEELAKKIDIKDVGKGGSKNSKIHRVISYPQAYFMNPDKKIAGTRIATAAGAYAGVAVGGRYLSGGTLTRDNYGRKDIAGVPFI